MIMLERFAYGPEATMGRLYVGDTTLWTIERPWMDNKPFESCIPTGTYKVVPYSSAKYPHVWEVTGVPERSKILIHVANYAHDVQGCIGVGMTKAKGAWSVSNSRDAIKWLQTHLSGEFEINIIQYIPQYP